MQETIALLITKGDTPQSDSDDMTKVPEFSESFSFHQVMRSFWAGHYDRCLYHAEKSSALSDIGQLKSIMIIFFGGLSCFHSKKKYKSSKKLLKVSKHGKLRE